MEHAPTVQFKTNNKTGGLKMLEAIDVAKLAFSAMTPLKFDSVSHCERSADGIWHVAIDAVESVARMGDNDLLVSHEIQLNDAGDILKFTRLRRYHREDKERA